MWRHHLRALFVYPRQEGQMSYGRRRLSEDAPTQLRLVTYRLKWLPRGSLERLGTQPRHGRDPA